MTDYIVNQSFTAFARQYPRGSKLAAADLSCWLPETAAAQKLKELLHEGVLAAAPVSMATAQAALTAAKAAEVAAEQEVKAAGGS